MTEELSPSKTSVFDQKAELYCESVSKSSQKHQNYANSKRHVTFCWCSRLAASKLPGADLAVEYL